MLAQVRQDALAMNDNLFRVNVEVGKHSVIGQVANLLTVGAVWPK